MAGLLKTQSSGVVGGIGLLPERSSYPLHFFLSFSAPHSSHRDCLRLPFAGSFDRRRVSPVKLANGSNRLTLAVVGGGTAAEPQLRGSEDPFVVESSFPSACAGEATCSESEGNLQSAFNGGADERRSRANLPPRICTLRAFGKSGEGVAAPEPDAAMSTFCKSVADSVEFSAEIQDWEILSGRLAMMVFASAVLLEALTGNNVFEKPDSQRLLEFFAALVVSVLGSAGFALAWQAKTRVTHTMSKGYESLINGLIDNVIDGLLFDEES